MSCLIGHIQKVPLNQKHVNYFQVLTEADINSGRNHYIFFNHDSESNYHCMQHAVKAHSPTMLNYHRKLEISLTSTESYFFKISDTHVEIDFSLLSANETQIFHELYMHIKNYISSPKTPFFIVCIHFEEIRRELKKLFHTYLCDTKQVHFILLTSQVSIFPQDILLNCIIKRQNFGITKEDESIHTETMKHNVSQLVHTITCEEFNITKQREILYDSFVKNHNMHAIVNDILFQLFKKEYITYTDNLVSVFKDIVNQLELYNNNYRSIYHMERLILKLMNLREPEYSI
jgi:hypothetical protein